MPEYQPCSGQRTETYIILTIVQKCSEIPGYDVKISYGSDHKNKNKKTKLRSCRCDTDPPPYPGQLYSITATPQRVNHNNLNGYSLSLPSTPSLLKLYHPNHGSRSAHTSNHARCNALGRGCPSHTPPRRRDQSFISLSGQPLSTVDTARLRDFGNPL